MPPEERIQEDVKVLANDKIVRAVSHQRRIYCPPYAYLLDSWASLPDDRDPPNRYERNYALASSEP